MTRQQLVIVVLSTTAGGVLGFSLMGSAAVGSALGRSWDLRSDAPFTEARQ
jgi:hypothetical protein